MLNAFNPRAASAYRRIDVETSMHTMDQHQLVSLLLDGVLNAVATARGALARNDVLLKCASIGKAVRIIEEGLLTALDTDNGGEIATNLQAVYDYALRLLLEANVKNDDAMLVQVAHLMEPIAEGWKAIKQQPEAANHASMAHTPTVRADAPQPMVAHA